MALKGVGSRSLTRRWGNPDDISLVIGPVGPALVRHP
jgi:hypothetical protein